MVSIVELPHLKPTSCLCGIVSFYLLSIFGKLGISNIFPKTSFVISRLTFTSCRAQLTIFVESGLQPPLARISRATWGGQESHDLLQRRACQTRWMRAQRLRTPGRYNKAFLQLPMMRDDEEIIKYQFWLKIEFWSNISKCVNLSFFTGVLITTLIIYTQ